MPAVYQALTQIWGWSVCFHGAVGPSGGRLELDSSHTLHHTLHHTRDRDKGGEGHEVGTGALREARMRGSQLNKELEWDPSRLREVGRNLWNSGNSSEPGTVSTWISPWSTLQLPASQRRGESLETVDVGCKCRGYYRSWVLCLVLFWGARRAACRILVPGPRDQSRIPRSESAEP